MHMGTAGPGADGERHTSGANRTAGDGGWADVGGRTEPGDAGAGALAPGAVAPGALAPGPQEPPGARGLPGPRASHEPHGSHASHEPHGPHGPHEPADTAAGGGARKGGGLLRSSLLMAVGTVVSRATGLVRSVLQAAALGRSAPTR